MSLVTASILSDVMPTSIPITAGVVVVPKDSFNKGLLSPAHPLLSRMSYGHAVCVSEVPFILVSEDAGMRWESSVVITDFTGFAKANPDILTKCMTRVAG